MDENATAEAAFFDFLGARERALEAAVGYLATTNVPSEHLRRIAESNSEILALAARVVLYQREGRGAGGIASAAREPAPRRAGS